ncbi:SRPBCC family protein [Nocardioides humilatus]|nr:SRPBCC family protein [Nocardioides humilatus]
MASHVIILNATIPAPPSVVWDVITDVGRADQIFRSVSGSEKLTEGDYGVGTVWHEKRTLFGHHGEEELHVVECESERRSVVDTKLGHDTIRTAYRLTPQGASGGQTRFAMTTTMIESDRTPAEKLSWKFFGGFSYDRTKRMLEHDLQDLEAEVKRRTVPA